MAPPRFTIRQDDLSGDASRDLLRFHLSDMVAISPGDSMNAVDLSALDHPAVTVLSAWDGERIAGIGALRVLSPSLGELKSMRTHPEFRGQGVGSVVLTALIDEARKAGLAQLALETGSGGPFDHTIAFYRRHGFAEGAPFGGYEDTAFNRFYWLDL